MDLKELLSVSYRDAAAALKLSAEDEQFILYMEWDALRSALAQYLGMDDEDIDGERCQITSIDSDDEGTEVAMVILPPKELPKILPCSLGDKQ